MVTTDWLKSLVNFESSKALVTARLQRIGSEADLVSFMRDY
jgi:hypothetical protein